MHSEARLPEHRNVASETSAWLRVTNAIPIWHTADGLVKVSRLRNWSQPRNYPQHGEQFARRLSRKPPMRRSGTMKTLSFRHPAQGKSDRNSELSVKRAAPVGCAAAHSLDVRVGPRGLRSLPGRIASPSRLRSRPELARGQWHPRPRQPRARRCKPGVGSFGPVGGLMIGVPARSTRRQDAAHEHQQAATNLGFVASCPQESRTGCPSFP